MKTETKDAKHKTKQDTIAWHPAFRQAMQLELEAYLDVLDFVPEHPLTSEPLKIDIVVIKKITDAIINHPLARIFRGYNLFEFKSHTDNLTLADFHKVYAYALLYLSFEKVAITDITITFVEAAYPREIFAYLRNVRGYTVTETQPGIYTVTGDIIPMQFIETKRLAASDAAYLRVLDNKANKDTLTQILETVKGTHKAPHSAFLDAILRANIEIFEEIVAMQKRKTLEQVLEESGLTAKWEARGVALGVAREKAFFAKNLIGEGWPGEKIARFTGLDLPTVESLYRELRPCS
jgi:hypothetical protein